LIEQAISQCTTDDLIRVEQCTDTHPTAALLKATLHTARTMREGRLYHDPFEQLALRKYTFYRQRDGHGGNLRERALLTLCRDHSLLQNLRADLALPLRVPSAFGPLNWLAPRARWLAGWTRQTLRIVRICVATGMAALSDIEARRLYKQWRETLEEQRWIPESVHAEE
jgi:hypothetical protein